MRIPIIPIFFAAILTFVIFPAHAQVPTNQDCLDAIPICQNVYSTSVSYSGEGTYPNEINNNSSCLNSGELNDVWYTFTVQTTGNLNFTITPNNSADDYDWAVYNLTNNSCSDIFTNPAIETSCNYSATPGTTGPNGGSTLNSQNASGTPYNQVVPVLAGQTYVVNVSNYSSTQYGYTINFSASTATIFDIIPPQILSVTNPGCGGNTLTVTFSENILCNTVQASDFSFSGPNGNYTVTTVNSAACNAGAQYDNTFTFTISPAITSAGTYTANLVGPVTDLCGNVAIYPASLPFTVGSFTFTNTTTPSSCGSNNGTANITVNGAGPFSYSWSPNVSTTNSANGLLPGFYSVTITDQANGCTGVDTFSVASNNSLSVTTSGNDSICPGTNTTMTANVAGGNNPITYAWSNGLPNQSSVTVTPASTTTYTLNITDALGCSAGPLLFTISVAAPVSLVANGASPICAGGGTTLNANASGGMGTINYNWNPGNISGNIVLVTPASTTTYTVTATDQCGQTATQTVNIIVQQSPVFNFTADTNSGCTPLLVHFSLDTTGLGNATFHWDFGDNGSTSNAAEPQHNFISAGCHSVSLTVSVPPGCATTQTIPCMIRTFAQPVASFSATPTLTDILNPLIYFTNTSSGANTWYWSYGDSTTSTLYQQNHTYDFPGNYPVYLIVQNDSGCSDTAYMNIVVNDYHTFYIPNAFTPNDDNHNEIFIPVFSNILSQDYDLMIFDRWGKIVFESKDPEVGWNGTWQNKGDNAPEDVYVYKIEYTDNLYKHYKMIGHISLIR
ncbi:MAG: gliding motility-associated C-terminal domain-containing protein [Bacteroidetes bacterium]|nr:gliding motility-associated C-terminal domain-containing protein [Bacteroidota bacterium]